MTPVRLLPAVLVAAAGALTASGCASVTPQDEREIGAEYSRQINAELPIVDDPALEAYLGQLGRRIAAGGRAGFSYRFFIVNAESINAFALPGGYVYVHRGLVEETDNMMELAGVLAHEIGHVEEHHSAEQIERAQNANLGVNLAYILLGRSPGGVERAAVGVGGGLVLARFSREAEDEADAVAIPLLVGAGIDPRGLPSFFHDLIEARERKPSALEGWFSTHPTTEERIDAAQRRIARLPASQRNGQQDDASFRSFRSRMTRYPAPPPEYREPGG